MSYQTRIRWAAVGALLAAGAAAAAWWYPSWRFNRDLRAAEQAFAAYDFPTAREWLSKCEARRPNDADVQLLACRAARRSEDIAAAEKHYSRYRELVREPSPDAVLERSLLDAQSGRTKEVLGYLFPLLDAKHPRSEEILEALAVGSVVGYNLNDTRLWLTELLAIAPKNPIGRMHRANTLSTHGRVDEAIAILRELVAENPGNYSARIALAEQLMITKEPQQAAESYREAGKIRPGEVRTLLGLTRAMLLTGNKDEIAKLVPELEQLRDHSEALLHLGRFAIQEQRWADAERYLSRAVQLAPNDHEVHRELGICLFQRDRPEESRKHTERSRAIEVDLARLEKLSGMTLQAPRDPEPRVEAAEICLRNGQASEGLRWLHGVLEIDPAHKPAHRILANYYAANGDPQRAAVPSARAK